jgi:hypothetical protein
VRRAQPLLPVHPELGEEDVAAVAEELLVVQLVFGDAPVGLVFATVGCCTPLSGSPLK